MSVSVVVHKFLWGILYALLNVMTNNVAIPLGSIIYGKDKGFWEISLMSRFCFILMRKTNDSFFISDLQLVNHQAALTWLKGRWTEVGWWHS